MEFSYGIIPVQKRAGEWWVLLIQHRKGKHWAFPKGHGEPGESPLAAATRELFEETGLSIVQVFDKTFRESYTFSRGGVSISKEVLYFPAEVQGKVVLQKSEILSSRWVKLPEAPSCITFPQAQAICKLLASALF